MTDIPHERASLKDIPGYVAGRKASDSRYSLAANETHFGPLPSVQRAIAAEAHHTHRYPDPGSARLRTALADKFGVATAEIGLGTGSVALCQQAIAAYCDQGDEVVFAWRSFEAYPILCRIVGAKAVQVPLTPSGEHDLAAMAAAITEKTRVLFVCTPNNPTGPAVGQAELNRFLDQVPTRVLVVLDEAYFEFQQPAGQVCDGQIAAAGRANVLVLRTFSKAYGLAALRVGYGIGPEAVVATLNKVALPFGISAVAEVAALASLSAQAELAERVGWVRQERDRLIAQVRDLGFAVPNSQGNFYWLPLGERAAEFANSCANEGLAVRAFPNEGVRVTIGESDANQRVLSTLATFA